MCVCVRVSCELITIFVHVCCPFLPSTLLPLPSAAPPPAPPAPLPPPPPPPAEYSSTLHQVLSGLESGAVAGGPLLLLLGGYLGLLLFTVMLAGSELRLPIVQYSKTPPPVRFTAAVLPHFYGEE
jgi:hypothetical protein